MEFVNLRNMLLFLFCTVLVENIMKIMILIYILDRRLQYKRHIVKTLVKVGLYSRAVFRVPMINHQPYS